MGVSKCCNLVLSRNLPRVLFFTILVVSMTACFAFIFVVDHRPLTQDLPPPPTSFPFFLPSVAIKVSTSPKPVLQSDDLINQQIQRDVENLPVAYMQKYRNQRMFYKKANCSKLPRLSQIELSDNNWQNFAASDRLFQFLGAYYDARQMNADGPSVHIVSMVSRMDPTGNFCQLWFADTKEPLITPVSKYRYIWHRAWGVGRNGSYQPYLVTCDVKTKQVPVAVSIVENFCDFATNLLKVNADVPAVKKDFAVCVKGLDYPDYDVSVRLVEWIELLSLLGADIINFYKLQVHHNVNKVLEYYEAQGRARVIPLTLAGAQPNHPLIQHIYLRENLLKKRHNEIITYNDCFYRNMNSHRYVVALDLDEVILPMDDVKTWQELITKVRATSQATNNKVYASYFARNVYFMDNHMHNHDWFEGIPKHLHMLQHVYRSKNFTRPRDFVKTFFDTNQSLLLHNHLPIACLGPGSCSYPIPVEMAQLQHYRSGCERSLKKAVCDDFKNNFQLDTNVWKYKAEVIERTRSVYDALGFSEDDLRVDHV